MLSYYEELPSRDYTHYRSRPATIDDVIGDLRHTMAERDTARAVAVRLEQENAQQAQVIANQVDQIADLGAQVNDLHEQLREQRRVNGHAYRSGIMAALMAVDRGGRAEGQLQALLTEVTP